MSLAAYGKVKRNLIEQLYYFVYNRYHRITMSKYKVRKYDQR